MSTQYNHKVSSTPVWDVKPGEQKCLDDIDEFGCHVIHVLEGSEGPPFAYSVGIQRTSGAPEVIVIGLKRDLAHFVVNEYNSRVRSGERFEAWKRYPGFLNGFDVRFEPVDKSQYREYVGWDLWLYAGDGFDLWQLVYPTTTGVWPRDASASEAFNARQPLLGTAVGGARSEQVECGEHGTQAATFVCQHIVESVRDSKPRGFWWAEDPENPRPDAWCSSCEEKVQSTGGEWTDESEAFAGVNLLCGACYDTARALNLGE